MKVWLLIDLDDKHMEFFSSAPNTVKFGSDSGNWPKNYQIWLGEVDGGDTICIESHYG